MGQRTLRFIIQIFKEKGVSRFNRENTLGFDHHSSGSTNNLTPRRISWSRLTRSSSQLKSLCLHQKLQPILSPVTSVKSLIDASLWPEREKSLGNTSTRVRKKLERKSEKSDSAIIDLVLLCVMILYSLKLKMASLQLRRFLLLRSFLSISSSQNSTTAFSPFNSSHFHHPTLFTLPIQILLWFSYPCFEGLFAMMKT
jgi:hypothetical protein